MVFRGLVVLFFFAQGLIFASPGYAFKVVASIPPLASLVRTIGGESVSVDLLVDGAVSPHDYVLKPSDFRKIKSADLVFWIGPAYEAFLVKPLKSESKKTVTLMDVPDMRLYPLCSGGEGGACSDCTSETVSIDGHIWLDPDNGIQIAQKIAQTLTRLDPAREADYTRRFEDLKGKIEHTKQDVQQRLSPYENTGFLTFHDGYQYFEKAFELQKGKALSLVPEATFSAKKLRDLKHLVRTENIQCLFAEPQFSPGLIKTLSRETNVKVGVLDPLGSSQTPYEDLLVSLATSFSTCLGNQP